MSPREALDAVALQGTRPFSWYASAGTLDFAGKGTQSVLNWTLSPNLESARFVNSKENPRNTHDNVKYCHDRIEIDASLQLSSEDQWLNEPALPVLIRFVAEYGDAPQGARWRTPLSETPIEDLMGQLPNGLSENESEPKGDNYFEVSGWSGFDATEWIEISATTVVHTDRYHSEGVTPLACVSTIEDRCEEPM